MRNTQRNAELAAITHRMLADLSAVPPGHYCPQTFRAHFEAIKARVELHPARGSRPSHMLQAASDTVRSISATCLPVAVAVCMHLYPYCALHWFPLPSLSVARLRRDALLRDVRRRRLILANAGGARSSHAAHPVTGRSVPEGLRVQGTFEYMSLASVADRALFRAPLDGTVATALCFADLPSDGIRVGRWKFADSMRLSDTAAITFDDHLVPKGRFIVDEEPRRIATATGYQRAWFHLLLAECHLARLQHLRDGGLVAFNDEQTASLHELGHLGRHAGDLLDAGQLDPLLQVSASIKLRTSLLSSTAAQALRARGNGDATRPEELQYIRLQPTSDPEIQRDLSCRAPLSISTHGAGAHAWAP